MDKLVQENSYRPDIDLVIMGQFLDHLRCHVLESTAEGVPLLFKATSHICLAARLNTPPEVTNLEHIIGANQQIFWLQIPVDESILVQKVDASHSLNEEIKCLILSEPLLPSNNEEQIALLHVLQDQIDESVVFETCVEPNDVDVLQLLLNLNFPIQGFLELWGFD